MDRDEQLWERFEQAAVNRDMVPNTDEMLRMLCTRTHVIGGGIGLNGDGLDRFLTAHMDAGEGRPFVPFDIGPDSETAKTVGESLHDDFTNLLTFMQEIISHDPVRVKKALELVREAYHVLGLKEKE